MKDHKQNNMETETCIGVTHITYGFIGGLARWLGAQTQTVTRQHHISSYFVSNINKNSVS